MPVSEPGMQRTEVAARRGDEIPARPASLLQNPPPPAWDIRQLTHVLPLASPLPRLPRPPCTPLHPPAVWDTISFASNGLVFFWAGIASVNYFIR